MKLNQMSGGDAAKQAVVRAVMMAASILEFAEFYKMVGNADDLRKTSTGNGGKTRALNSDYPDNQIDPDYARPSLKILGDKVETDLAYERRGFDIPSVRAANVLEVAEGIGRKFQDLFFNGVEAVGTPNDFDGLKVLTPAAQIISPAGGNGLQVISGSDNAAKKSQQQFKELLDLLIERVKGGPDVVVMDGQLHARLSSIAADQVSYRVNEFGQQEAFYNGIPLRRAGFTDRAQSARVLGFNETQGTSTDCTSVFAMKFGEMRNVTVASNIGVDYRDLDLVGVHYTELIDFDASLALQDDRAVARLDGIRLG